MGRAPCCDKANVKKGPWSPEEDAKLKEYIDNNGTGGSWIALPHKAGLKRCGKSCRLRWLNYLRPNIKHGEFTDHEDRMICTLFYSIGSRWSIIAAQLPGRTDNDIKNYWNTKLKKKHISMNFQANNYNNTTPHQIQKQSHSPSSISSFLQTSASSSSSPSQSISYRQQQHQPNWCFGTNIFEPVMTPFSSANYSINPASDVANLQPMQQYYQVNDNSTSASTSTSSDQMGVQNYSNLYDGWSTTTITTSTQEDHHHDPKQNEKMSWESEGLLDFGIEEIKQLICAGSTSTGSNYNSLFDEN